MARNFQYKVEVFFREIILNGPLWETKHNAIRTEFQKGRSPHVHSFIWIPEADLGLLQHPRWGAL